MLIEWLVRALVAYRSALMLPLPPMLFKFVGNGDRVRQLCIGIYAFIWIFLFIYQIRDQASTNPVQSFRHIPWTSVYVPPPASPPTAALRESHSMSISMRFLSALSLQLTFIMLAALVCSAYPHFPPKPTSHLLSRCSAFLRKQ